MTWLRDMWRRLFGRPESAAVAQTGGKASPAPVSAIRAPAAPLATTTWSEAVRGELSALLATCVITDPARFRGARTISLANRARYEALGRSLGGIPWWFIAAIHGLESSFLFTRHLHNGDPLTARTRQVPAGRPPTGEPPFTWEQSGRDALTMPGKAYDRVTDWSPAHALWLLENYNGLGYRLYRGIQSPYLWAGTNHYTAGKYVADGKWDGAAVSKQAGAAGLLLTLGVQQWSK